MDQAEGLRRLVKSPTGLDKLKALQVELRSAIIAGKYKDADRLMALLDKAQKELEETHWR
jgi:glycogen debranching enzyme